MRHPRFLACFFLSIAIIALFSAIPVIATAQQKWGGKDAMNGYRLSDYGNFIRDWHFVTVRFRKDTGEIRWTYANDLAWKALQEGKADYPDGAVFAKIGVMSGEDEAFPSSIVPMGAKRYQLMVMDREKHKDTDGWGYALFDRNGKTMDEDPAIQIASCHACHKVVPERGYVFSQPLHLAVGEETTFVTDMPVLASRVEFFTVKPFSLPNSVLPHLPVGTRFVRVVTGEMQTAMFSGTIDEIRPILIQQVRKHGHPAALVKSDGSLFSLVFKTPGEEKCQFGTRPGMPLRAVFTTEAPDGTRPVVTTDICDPNP